MNATHERSRRLLLDERVQGLRESEARWLERHLSECAECRAFSRRLSETLHALRGPEVSVEAALLAVTKRRMHARARARADAARLRRQLSAFAVLGAAIALMVVCGLWFTADRMRAVADLPIAVKLSVAVLVWFMPAVVGAVAAGLAQPIWPREAQPSWGRYAHDDTQ